MIGCLERQARPRKSGLARCRVRLANQVDLFRLVWMAEVQG